MKKYQILLVFVSVATLLLIPTITLANEIDEETNNEIYYKKDNNSNEMDTYKLCSIKCWEE